MPIVRVLPKGIVYEAAEGSTIMGAAQSHDYYWPTTCGGVGRCTTCACLVVSGMENLSPRGRAEERVLAEERGRQALKTPIRLACQAQVHGHVVVEKIGVRLPLALGGSSLGGDEESGG